MTGDKLRRDHALDLIHRLDADQSIDRGVTLPPKFLGVCIFKEPDRLNGLIGKDVVPVIGHRPADAL